MTRKKTMKERKVMIIKLFLKYLFVIYERASELFLLVMSCSICCKFICCCVAYISLCHGV
jgi:hypothetical protein